MFKKSAKYKRMQRYNINKVIQINNEKPAENKIERKIPSADISFDGLLVKPTPTETTEFPSRPLMDKKIIPKAPFCLSILGRVKSGKTHALSFMMNNQQMYKRYFDKVIVFGKTIMADGTWKFIQKDKVIPDNFVEELDSLVKTLKNQADDKALKFKDRDNLLIVFEDITAQKKLLTSKSFELLMTTYRHFKASVICISHYYKKLTPTIRNNVNSLFVFPCNLTQLEVLAEDFKIADKTAFFNMARYAFEKTEQQKKPFLFINLDDDEHPFRKSFSEYLSLER